MVTQISLGNAYQSGGKTVIGGSQSQIDTEGLIKALTEARRAPAVQLENKNKQIDAKTASYNTLKSLLSRFQSAVDTLRNPPGVNNASRNIFQYRTAAMTATGVIPAANYMGITVEPGANTQNFTVNRIQQLARETKQDTGIFTVASATSAAVRAAGDPMAGQLTAGTFALRNIAPGGSPVEITLNEGDSLQQVVNKFNAVRGSTGIQANLLKVSESNGESQYKIVFTGTQTGLDYGFDLGDAGTVLEDSTGVLSNILFNTSQGAQNVMMTIDGVQIERGTNVIADAISGVTFTLKQEMTDGNRLNVEVRPDTEIVKNALVQFADVYNEFRLFAAKQQELGDDGLPTDEAVLATETLMRSIISQMSSEVTRVVAGITGGQPERLADIGINFSDFAGDGENVATKNIMVIDTDKLTSALNANFDGVRGLFEFTMTSDSPNLTIFKRTNQLNVSNFTIVKDGDTFKGRYQESNGDWKEVAFTGTPLSGGGTTLTGERGTVFEGLELIYVGDAANFNDIHVRISQGFGDRLYNLMQSVLDPKEGSLTRVMEGLKEQSTRNSKEIASIDEKVALYRDQLIRQYAALEAALTKANQLLSLLDQQAKAREAS